jgi:hypothetical protein
MDDLLPRADISGQITGDLVGRMSSSVWKERKEALDEVEAIVNSAGGRIQPCVSTWTVLGLLAEKGRVPWWHCC